MLDKGHNGVLVEERGVDVGLGVSTESGKEQVAI